MCVYIIRAPFINRYEGSLIITKEEVGGTVGRLRATTRGRRGRGGQILFIYLLLDYNNKKKKKKKKNENLFFVFLFVHSNIRKYRYMN